MISFLLLSSQCRKAIDPDRDAKRASDSETGSKARVKVESSDLDNEENSGNGTTTESRSEASSGAKEYPMVAPHNPDSGGNDSADSSVYPDDRLVDTEARNIQSELGAEGYTSDADAASANVEITPLLDGPDHNLDQVEMIHMPNVAFG